MESPEEPPTEGEEFSCIRCSATYLSEEALERHYDWNPEHAEPIVLDADALESDGETLRDGAWLEFDDRVETFLTVADGVDGRSLEMTYRPEDGDVVVEGPRTQTIDVSDAQEVASDRLRWSFDGTYLTLSFLK